MLFIQEKNNLLVSVVPKHLIGGDRHLIYLSVRANYNMTGKELLDQALEAWNLQDDGKEYRLVAMRPDGEIPVSLEKNLKESGLHNGSPLQIVEN
jgi:hypothetical protein